MVFQIRKIKNNNIASGFGTILVIFPFIISMILTMVFIPMGITETGLNILYPPDGYEDMTPIEREAWLTWEHDGIPKYEYKLRFKLSFPDFAGDWFYIYPDGTQIESDIWENFVNNDGDYMDPVGIATDVMTLNPPALEKIGIFGTLIRVIMLVCIAVGLVEILWI